MYSSSHDNCGLFFLFCFRLFADCLLFSLLVAVSPKPERSHPPKSVYMYVTSIYTCMNFLSRFRSIKFFDDHGL